MHLVWFELHGYKRFALPTKLHVDGKLIAIVGPNEAGKTSLLDAFVHCNGTEVILSHGPSQETTRGKDFDNSHEIIEATYALDEEDRKIIEHIPGAGEVRWYSVARRVGDKSSYVSQRPRPKRNLGPRMAAHREMLKFRDTVADAFELPDEDTELELDSLTEQLESKKETLDAVELDAISNCADQIEDYCIEHKIVLFDSLPQILRDLAKTEAEEHPEHLVRELLFDRCPRYLMFTDEDRQLESEYDINGFFRNEKGQDLRIPKIPKAIRNLVSACDLNLRDLYEARVSNDEGRIETLLDQANSLIRNLMTNNWSQSNVTVRLRLNNSRLHILVGATGSQFVRIAERSDGLRQFVALLMFLSNQPRLTVKPILLIDEAERHLHYDAQADLIQMLARQDVAAKVIFTTHSIGSLPEDLGTGVRLVEPNEAHHSTVNNWFWDSDVPGFSRLLFGMGASTLAFIPLRFSVITEGAFEMIVLPTLLRLANNLSHLGFQVAPGLSSATAEQIAMIDGESPRTVYLVDSDNAGDKIRRKIIRAGIPKNRILQMPKVNQAGSVTEDFVSDKAFVRAVNTELARSYGNKYKVSVSEVAAPSRPKSLGSWCAANGIREPNKRAIAYNLLELVHEFPIIRNETIDKLQELYTEIRNGLGLQSQP